jgi:hypothetical protein
MLRITHRSCCLCCLQVFLEETSLVARPAVPFPDLKERLEARMKWLGIKVRLEDVCDGFVCFLKGGYVLT